MRQCATSPLLVEATGELNRLSSVLARLLGHLKWEFWAPAFGRGYADAVAFLQVR